MNKVPLSEHALQSSIRDRALVAEGSIDEGVQSAPVAVENDTRLKKIYVYADNVWTPRSATDYRIVRVTTDAFDLTGWIDFTHARVTDQFQTEVRVTMAHASDVLLQRSGFQGGGNLTMMQQMAFAPAICCIIVRFPPPWKPERCSSTSLAWAIVTRTSVWNWSVTRACVKSIHPVRSNASVLTRTIR